jgi:hypothetical protein
MKRLYILSFGENEYLFFQICLNNRLAPFLLCLGLFFFSCQENSKPNNPSPSPIITEKVKPTDGKTKGIAKKIETQKKCAIAGDVLEENELWLKAQGRLICILADSTTKDPNLGPSHRVLEVYNTYTCSLLLRLTLPVNESPDFPYYLADINYNTDSKMVAIKAAKSILCLDLKEQKLLPHLFPKYKAKRADSDNASGNIIRLELWEDFLIGYAAERGTFVFDLKNAKTPSPVLPLAEFKLGENRYNSLFLLPSAQNKYQAIMPQYDWDEEKFSVNPLFKEPVALNKKIQESALNNQYLVLRTKSKKNALLIDLKNRINKQLPPELNNKPVKEILKWAKK